MIQHFDAKKGLPNYKPKSWYEALLKFSHLLVPLALRYLSTVPNDHLLPWFPAVSSSSTFNRVHGIHALYNLAKHNMLTIQPEQ